MACLALSLQPSNGADILLQTREWFPPARALAALSSFRQTRLAFSSSSSHSKISSSPVDVDSTSDGGRINNIFECINTVNQAVSVIVAACRGIDVTPEKLHRKYLEIYMALDIVLRGVGSVRLVAFLIF